MSVKTKKAANDPSRFEGEGLSYKAKLIGIEDVKDARGDQMCQEALVKLKNLARIAGGHKRKIIINVNLEGLKITDAISLIVLHSHAVNQISFISRDSTDNRAFGYISGTEDGLHKFFAIKTATAAEQLVNALKDLFQVVYEMKRKEEDASKEKQETGGDAETAQTQGEGSVSGDTPSLVASSDTENSNQVTTDSVTAAPEVQPEPIANLLDLEDMADNILKGIQRVNTLEFDFLTNDTPQSESPTLASPAVTVTSTTPIDPWGLSSTETAAKPDTSSSALGDLAGLQTGPLTTNFPLQTGFGSPTSFNTVPVSMNPFGNDPFNSLSKQPTSAFGATNPFGSEFHQPFGTQGMPPRMGQMGAYGVMPGIVPHGVMSPQSMGVIHNPIFIQHSASLQAGNPFADEDPTLMQTGKRDTGLDLSFGSDTAKTRSKSPNNDLFGDLLDIKKSSSVSAKSPRDMFIQANATEKKSMNALMTSGASPRASPVPAMLKPGISPRASPVPTMQMKPGISPRNSPVPTMHMQPEISSRASPVAAVMKPMISPQGSPLPTTPTTSAQSIPFDVVFGAAVEQGSDKSLLD